MNPFPSTLSSTAKTGPPLDTSFEPQRERVLILEAGRSEGNYWRDLWAYRELFAILAWRDLAVRYKQTVIGVGWAIIRPILTMIIFTTIFGRVAKLPSDGTAPYPIMVFAGMLPWTLISAILSDASNSLVGNSHLIGKVYFPRLIVPSATIVVALVDFAISLVLLLPMMAWFHFWPNWHVLLMPLFVVFAVLVAMGPALLMAAMNVKYRDFRYLVPFVLQFGLYISPVGFSSSIVPTEWKLLYYLNPAVAAIDGFRWCILGDQSNLDGTGLLLSAGVTALLTAIGIVYFRRTERIFADVI